MFTMPNMKNCYLNLYCNENYDNNKNVNAYILMQQNWFILRMTLELIVRNVPIYEFKYTEIVTYTWRIEINLLTYF